LKRSAGGWRVPEDIAIVGLGDLDLADYVVPALTSARIPGYRMGRIAADMIVRRLQGEILKTKTIDVGFSFVERGSTMGTP
jgi:LacI family transcriptional regulator, gluconate utilization system Gnt-I transcriptional repressor